MNFLVGSYLTMSVAITWYLTYRIMKWQNNRAIAKLKKQHGIS